MSNDGPTATAVTLLLRSGTTYMNVSNQNPSCLNSTHMILTRQAKYEGAPHIQHKTQVVDQRLLMMCRYIATMTTRRTTRLSIAAHLHNDPTLALNTDNSSRHYPVVYIYILTTCTCTIYIIT